MSEFVAVRVWLWCEASPHLLDHLENKITNQIK